MLISRLVEMMLVEPGEFGHCDWQLKWIGQNSYRFAEQTEACCGVRKSDAASPSSWCPSTEVIVDVELNEALSFSARGGSDSAIA